MPGFPWSRTPTRPPGEIALNRRPRIANNQCPRVNPEPGRRRGRPGHDGLRSGLRGIPALRLLDLPRYGLARVLTHPVGGWPWSTLVINVLGSLLIGVLMAVLPRMQPAPQLARPFLGTGILGGFTTFSTYAVDIRTMAVHGHPVLALAYAGATAVACLAAVAAALALARGALRRHRVRA